MKEKFKNKKKINLFLKIKEIKLGAPRVTYSVKNQTKNNLGNFRKKLLSEDL